MTITFIGQTTQSTAANATTTLTVAKPSGSLTGDFLITVIAMTTPTNDSSMNYTTIPSGWALAGTGIDSSDTETGIRVSVYTKVAAAGEPANYSWGATGVSGRIAATVLTYRGANAITSGKFITTLQKDKSTSRSTGSLTVNGDSLIVTVIADRFGSQSYVMPDTVRATVSTTNTSYAISDTNTAVPAGTYVKTARATNEEFVGVNMIFGVHVTSPTNQAPTVSVGTTQTVSPGSTIQLTGLAFDADGTIASYAWTYVSGPSNPTITNASSNLGSVVLSTPGTYVYKLQATDSSGLTGSANQTVIVSGTAVASPSVVARVSDSIYYLVDASGSTASSGGALTYTISPSATSVAPGKWLVSPLQNAVAYSVTISEAGIAGTATINLVVPGSNSSGGSTVGSTVTGTQTLIYINGAWG